MNLALFRSLLIIVLLLHSSAEAFAQTPPQPWLGVILEKTTIIDDQGVVIENVLRNSPAIKSDLRPGDRIISINGEPVNSLGKLQMLLRGQDAQATVKIVVIRKGKRLESSVALAPAPAMHQLIEDQLLDQLAPSFAFETVAPASRALDLSSMKGKPTIVEFWATWCTPCKAVAADLGAIASKYGDRIHIVGISSEPAKTITQYAAQHGAAYLLAHDLGERGHAAFFVRTYPIAFLLDAEHRVIGIYIGTEQRAKIEARLDKLLEPDPLPSKVINGQERQ
ncbi:MAG: PDZ domain-containing protein [Bradymonadaceae bacterium]|nr:PDZ domain-containing protein [Lujinxingiaceae bacterium]